MRKIHKVWLVGANTILGKQLINDIDPRSINVISTDINDLDVTDIDSSLGFTYLNQPDAIINCYEMSNCLECENNTKEAFKINTIVARNLAVCSRKIGARLVQLSTDLVFSSEDNASFNEFDTPNPQNMYALSKFEGEKFVKELAQKYFILRTSYIYTKDSNFEEAKTIYKGRKFYPTSTIELSKFIIKIMNTPEYGLYHATDIGGCSYNEFISEINKLKNESYSIIDEDKTIDIGLKQFMLEISDLYKFPNWKDDLKSTITK